MRILDVLTPYHVSYRVGGEKTSEGSSQERYADLVARLEKLTPVERSRHFDDEAHTATSSWLVYSTEKSAEELGAKLAKKLSPGVDLLEVVEAKISNRFELTE